MIRDAVLLLAMAFLAACTTDLTGSAHAPLGSVSVIPLVPPFSLNAPGSALPEGWQAWNFGPTKIPTTYSLVQDPDSAVTVMRAVAIKSASGMFHALDPGIADAHAIQWRWRVENLIPNADVRQRDTEDSPVRIVLGFDGDRSRLSFRDQIMCEQVRMVTGEEMPYATLIYVWDNHLAPGTVVPNPHTGRIRMLVAESGPKAVGRWVSYQRDFADDFRRAFGEEPGKLITVGVFSDTDNTGESAVAYYGDIHINRPSR